METNVFVAERSVKLPSSLRIASAAFSISNEHIKIRPNNCI